jgi:phage terminase small subunit
MKELNPKQERFCKEYVLSDENGKLAATKAGYSPATADVQASRLLTNVNVLNRIKELKSVVIKEAEDKFRIDAQWVLQRFKDISDRCMTAEPVMIRDGNNLIESGEYKFDSSGANKATENIGKHIGFYSEDNNQKRAVLRIGFDD